MPDYRLRLQRCNGLGELRWTSENKRHRLMGFFVGEAWYAVMGCIHKQQIYKPPNALETAMKRKAQIERGEANAVEYDL